MESQLYFAELDETLYEVDEKETRNKALSIIKRYREFTTGAKEYSLKVTSTYTIEPRTFNNQFNSSVEDNVIRKLDYIIAVENAVNRMNDPDERRIIVEGYMSNEKHNWIKMSSIFHISKTDYYRKRTKALVSFARALNKEVFKY